MTPVFSSSECLISRVLSRFYLSEGLFVLATVVLRSAVFSRVLAWFWVGFGKIAFFMTLFLAFWNLGLFAFFSRMLLFLEFLLVFASFSCL